MQLKEAPVKLFGSMVFEISCISIHIVVEAERIPRSVVCVSINECQT